MKIAYKKVGYIKLEADCSLVQQITEWRATASVLGYNEALHVFTSQGFCFVSAELYEHVFSE